jgi:hypothetical protein
MKKFILALALLCSVSTVSYADDLGPGRLPDTKTTPGFARTTDPKDIYICAPTKAERHSTKEIRKFLTPSIKELTYVAYHLKTHKDIPCNGVKQFCQVDHLISLELGGDPKDPRNLWIQPYEGLWNAHDKDKLENELHKQVCLGKMDLADVQKRVSTNWIELYKQVFKTDKPLPIGKADIHDDP